MISTVEVIEKSKAISDIGLEIQTLNNAYANHAKAMSETMEKIKELKANIKNTYFSTQELFITTYFSTIFKSLITSSDLDRFRKKLYNFQELAGNTDNYYFFNNFYIEMMEKLDKRFDMLAELDSHSTYLIPRKESTFSKIIKYIQKLLLKREFEIDKK